MDTANATSTDVILTGSELTDRDREILEFERQWWKYAGAKETATIDRFGLNGTRYYARLNWIIDQPEALAVDPLVVRRLRRLRAARAAARTRRLG